MGDQAKEGKLILADGPIKLYVFNPKGLERFSNRVCDTCRGPIMEHWMKFDPNPDLRGTYWCDEACTKASEGMTV